VIFFRTRAPIEPVAFVEKICQDAAAGVQLRNCRYVKRLTPITALEKATAKGLETVAEKVLAPHFHVPDQAGKKVSVPCGAFAIVHSCFICRIPFLRSDILIHWCVQKFAIRPSIRNNKEFTRDGVIKTVAAAVGPGHKVDLHGYDLLILVEIYQVR
jgi:tRNA acetyltransferase TAN1